jgi:hypothetical protein
MVLSCFWLGIRPWNRLIIDTVAWLLLDETSDLDIEVEAERVH